MKQKLYLGSIVTILIFTTFFYGQENEQFYENIKNIALNSIGTKIIPSVQDEKFLSDCTGFVLYTYRKAGLDLKHSYQISGRMVDSLYNGLAKKKLIHKTKINQIQIGDILFFDNTYDPHGKNSWNVPLTHVGIVTDIDKYFTITFVHYASGKVKKDFINLNLPKTYAVKTKDGKLKIINSFLRRDKGEGYPQNHYIASFFFDSYAHVPVKKL